MKIQIKKLLILALLIIPIICHAQPIDQESMKLIGEICQSCNQLFPLVENLSDKAEIQSLVENVMSKMMKVRFQYAQIEVSQKMFYAFSAAKVSMLQKDDSGTRRHLASAKIFFGKLYVLVYSPPAPLTLKEAIRRILYFRERNSILRSQISDKFKTFDECTNKMNVIMQPMFLHNRVRFTFDKASGRLDYIRNLNIVDVPGPNFPDMVNSFNALFEK
ncbi:MAG: hypothetical protein HQM10_07375 [Candidatus Riflebacteria bacterium]|nr:hypothetical protein [Candidatus Riflebacteria bacterium]